MGHAVNRRTMSESAYKVSLPSRNGMEALIHSLDFRLIPSALMREASVVGFMPSNSAAPSAPKSFPPHCFKAAAMLSRSWRLSSSQVRSLAGVFGGAMDCRTRSSTKGSQGI